MTMELSNVAGLGSRDQGLGLSRLGVSGWDRDTLGVQALHHAARCFENIPFT